MISVGKTLNLSSCPWCRWRGIFVNFFFFPIRCDCTMKLVKKYFFFSCSQSEGKRLQREYHYYFFPYLTREWESLPLLSCLTHRWVTREGDENFIATPEGRTLRSNAWLDWRMRPLLPLSKGPSLHSKHPILPFLSDPRDRVALFPSPGNEEKTYYDLQLNHKMKHMVNEIKLTRVNVSFCGLLEQSIQLQQLVIRWTSLQLLHVVRRLLELFLYTWKKAKLILWSDKITNIKNVWKIERKEKVIHGKEDRIRENRYSRLWQPLREVGVTRDWMIPVTVTA